MSQKHLIHNLPIPDDWKIKLTPLLSSEEVYELGTFINERRKVATVYPEREKVFRAFMETPYNKVRCVILGMDPFHDGSAEGLCFLTKKNNPSLRFINKEIARSYGENKTINLENLPSQGVLLLNTALTVEKGKPGSHMKIWEKFTTAVFKALNDSQAIVYMAWGNHAKTIIKNNINPMYNYILESSHPVAEIYGKGSFIGCNHFLKTDEILMKLNNEKIIWT